MINNKKPNTQQKGGPDEPPQAAHILWHVQALGGSRALASRTVQPHPLLLSDPDPGLRAGTAPHPEPV